jgi:hypothetical protein
MARVVPQGVAQVEEACHAPGTRMREELHMLGCHHGQVTAELARRWRLPPRFVNGFAHAAAPLDARPFSLLAAVLQMSSVLADGGSLHLGIQEALDEVDLPLLQHLRLDVPWLRTTAPRYDDLAGPVEELLAN